MRISFRSADWHLIQASMSEARAAVSDRGFSGGDVGLLARARSVSLNDASRLQEARNTLRNTLSPEEGVSRSWMNGGLKKK